MKVMVSNVYFRTRNMAKARGLDPDDNSQVILVSTNDPNGGERVAGEHFTEDDVTWDEGWFRGLYADQISDIIDEHMAVG